MPSALIVDDHATLRESLAFVLANEGYRVRSAGTVAEGLRAGAAADVAIVDLVLPDGSGLDVVRGLLERDPSAGVLLLTGADDPVLLDQALESGARGVALKGSSLSTVLAAARAVAAGGTWIDPAVPQRLSRLRAGVRDGAVRLSPREREVLQHVAEGRDSAAIAGELLITEHTVRTHLRNVLRKMGARSRAHAVARALRAGEL